MLWESSGLCAERSSISSTSLRRSRDCGRSDPNASCRAAGQPSPRRCCLEHLALGDDRDSAGFPECPANRQRPSAGRPWLPDLGSGVQPDARRAMTGSRDNTAWVRDLSGSSPRERTFNAEGQARHPGIGRCRRFPGASLLRRSGSLLGRFNSLIARLGNLPLVFWNNNGLVARVRSSNGSKSSFCQFFPAAQGLAGSRELRDRPLGAARTEPSTGGELPPAPSKTNIRCARSKTPLGGKGGSVA